MSARNFDNLPPHATNTVTISTTPQVRIAPGGQIRSIGVPVRPQPVPIRKVHHDGSAATTSTSASTSTPTATFSSIHVKDEPADSLDYQSTTNAATSSGPLLPPGSTAASTSANANSFQQYQRGSGQGTSSNNGNSGNLSMDQPAPVNLASKVAEVFLTAGHAFQKLGDLTLQLHTTTDTDESKWTDKEVDNLRDALTRFAHELDQISTCVASRTTKHIKNDIKRRHMIEENNQQVKRMAITGTSASGASYSAISTLGPGGASSMHTVPLAQKRVAIQPTTKVVATRAVVPTRYTVGPSSSSSGLNNGGMPQLQQQSHTTRLISNSLTSSTRIGSTSGLAKFTPASMTKRIMTAGPSTSSSNQQKSGALVMDSND